MRLEADTPELEPPADPTEARRLTLGGLFTLDGLREPARRLFAPVRRSRLTWPGWLAAAVGVVAIATYSLLRVGGAGAFNSIWAEDGANFLSDAYMLPVRDTIFKPINGYFVVLPRLMSVVAAAVPVSWGPAVLTSLAALFSAGTAVMVYVASGNIMPRPFLRLVVSFWVVAAPLAESTLAFGPNMVAPLQFVELYGLFWALIWTPVRPWARAVQCAFVVLCCVSTFLAVVFLPVAVLRVWASRSKWSVGLLAAVVAGGILQTLGIVFGLTSRAGISHPRADPLWALMSYVGWGLPFGVVGEKTMHDPGFIEANVHSGGGGFWYWSGVVATWCVVAAVILAAVRRLTGPAWFFAAVAAGESVLLLCVQIMVQGKLELRYAYTPSLLAVAAMLALLRPAPVSRHASRIAWIGAWFPAVALTLLLALSAAANYRMPTPRTAAVPWTVQVAQSTRKCRQDIRTPFVLTYSIPGWFVIVPCSRVR